MSFMGDKKERTEEAFSNWLGCWESHFELHPKPNALVEASDHQKKGLLDVRERGCARMHTKESLCTYKCKYLRIDQY